MPLHVQINAQGRYTQMRDVLGHLSAVGKHTAASSVFH